MGALVAGVAVAASALTLTTGPVAAAPAPEADAPAAVSAAATGVMRNPVDTAGAVADAITAAQSVPEPVAPAEPEPVEPQPVDSAEQGDGGLNELPEPWTEDTAREAVRRLEEPMTAAMLSCLSDGNLYETCQARGIN